MIIKPQNRIFHAPDASEVTGGASPAMTAETPIATPAPIQETTPVKVTFEKVDVIKELGLPGVKSPKEVFGEEEGSANKKLEADSARIRQSTKRDEFKPVAPAKKVPSNKAPKEEKPKADVNIPPEEPEKPNEPTQTKPEPVAPNKIKVKGKEYTEEELAELLEKKPEPPTEKLDEPKEPKAEEQTQPPENIQEKDKGWIDQRSKGINLSDYGINVTDEETLDAILSGGADGLKMFTETLSKIAALAELNARKYFAEAANPLFQQLAPVINQHQRVEQFTRENQFLARFPDIKTNPKGLDEARTVRALLDQKQDRIMKLRAVNMAQPEEIAFTEEYRKLSPDQLDEDVAYHVRTRLGINQQALQQQVHQPAPNLAAIERPKPHVGQPVGGRGAKSPSSSQSNHVNEVRTYS